MFWLIIALVVICTLIFLNKNWKGMTQWLEDRGVAVPQEIVVWPGKWLRLRQTASVVTRGRHSLTCSVVNSRPPAQNSELWMLVREMTVERNLPPEVKYVDWPWE